MQNAAAKAISWTEQGLVPDSVIRHCIRRLLQRRLADIQAHDCEAIALHKARFIRSMDQSAIAPLPAKANEQHYEVPTEFFLAVLGARAKYSCCHWNDGVSDLDTAETDALKVTCQRAGIENGAKILELGCGWGSLTLWMAERYPDSHVTAVSNSNTQRKHILQAARRQHRNNIDVLTCDMNEFSSTEKFDRIVSLEMFEHMRNYGVLFRGVSDWLKPDGRFFMHIFCHRDVPYTFEERNATDWMSRHFFSGGMMPSDDLPLHFQEHLRFLQQWRWGGHHYEKTANAWLRNMDQQKATLWPLFEKTYGRDAAQQWWMRWRMFFMACAELFACDQGQQWRVSHYLFEKQPAR
jgi:cyclopropane-fatty-acyl-phospholipid synthase